MVDANFWEDVERSSSDLTNFFDRKVARVTNRIMEVFDQVPTLTRPEVEARVKEIIADIV